MTRCITINKVKDVINAHETKEVSVFNTHTKYITLEFVGKAKDVVELYGSEYVVTCNEYEHGVDIFI